MTEDTSLLMVLPLSIAEGREADWEVFFAEMRASVAAQEPGTLQFDMFRVKDRPGRYLVIERYADQAAWEMHSQLQGARGIVGKMMSFQSAPPDFQFLETIGGPLR